MNSIVDWTIAHRTPLVPLVFGFAALYLLMPRGGTFLRPVGIVLGLVALGGLCFVLVPPGMTLHAFLFYLFAGVAIVAATATITYHNPIYSALSFALVTLCVCGLFLLRGAQFLAAATVIIYAGAIVVTFLFIIMLARQSGNAPYDRRAREPLLATLATFVLLGGLLFTIDAWALERGGNQTAAIPAGRLAAAETAGTGRRSLAGFVPIPAGAEPHSNSRLRAGEAGRLRALGRSLFSDYLVAVELAGTLLLVAGVGAVAIAPRRSTGKL
jgi:NADH-quinone oxidoreductase subunit J